MKDFELVFHTDERDSFCSVWKGMNLPPPGDPCVPQGPTATAYLAYLNSKRKTKKLCVCLHFLLSVFFFLLFNLVLFISDTR